LDQDADRPGDGLDLACRNAW